MKYYPFFKRSPVFGSPASPVGWLIIALYVIYDIYSFWEIDSRSHSVSDTLINRVFNAVLAAAVLVMIMWITSDRPRKKW
jgi:hypothetical protein